MKNIFVITLFLGLLVIFGSQAFAADSLTTLFAQNNYSAGNTFDITPSKDIVITGMDCNVGPAHGPATCYVYYKSGTSVGFENNAGAWTVLASGSGTAAGQDNPTFFDLPAAEGTTFLSGQTYGIYVYITSYAYHNCYYTNGMNTYSNADLSLTTNSGQAAPGFGAFFPQRQWNGTIHYRDPGPDLPWGEVLVNHFHTGVIKIISGQSAKVDFAVHAGIGGGTPVDVWIGIKTPSGFFTYDQAGPFLGWNSGLRNAYFTGALADMSGTCLDFPLGVGAYTAYVAIDTLPNGILNMNKLYTVDRVDFEVVNPPAAYSFDDGSTEDLLSFQNGGEVCWMQKFTTFPGGETIRDVRCIFGSAKYPGLAPGNGSACEIFVWDDPTDDGDPSDCVLLSSETIAVQQVDTDTYAVYPLSVPAQVSKEFYVGCKMPHTGGQHCIPIDMSGPYYAGSAWTCGTNTPPFNPNNLMNNQFSPSDFNNYVCIRAGY